MASKIRTKPTISFQRKDSLRYKAEKIEKTKMVMASCMILSCGAVKIRGRYGLPEPESSIQKKQCPS